MNDGYKQNLFILKKEYENIIYELAKGEGSTMTFAQTVATINNQIISHAKPREIILVNNLKKGLDYILDLLYAKEMIFSKHTLCTLNSLVASDDKGINPLQAQDFFDSLLQDFNKQIKNNENIIKLTLLLFKHQFFGDGNKRTAQLMMNGLLVSNGFTPFVLNFKEEENVDALIKFYDENDTSSLLNICLKKQEEIKQAYQIQQ